MRALQLEQGHRFGLLAVVGEVERTTPGPRRWSCQCDCGENTVVAQNNLTSGNSTSCGCQRKSTLIRRNTTHGRSNDPEYVSWLGIKHRCLNSRSNLYSHYGGRGIKVDLRWIESYEAFITDVGRKPTPAHSIERIDVNGNYEPTNVTWATQKEQTRNTRRSRRVTINGITKTVSAWAEDVGLSPYCIYRRLNAGWPEAQAVTSPLRTGRRATAGRYL